MDSTEVITVSEMLGCSPDHAQELLDIHDGEVNKIIDVLCVSRPKVDAAYKAKSASGISSVLKRKVPDDCFVGIDSHMSLVKKIRMDSSFKKTTVFPSRNFDMDSELAREYRIAEGQFLRMVGRRESYDIKSIDIVQNYKLEKRFETKKQEFKSIGLDVKPLLIFHGTPQKNIEPILRDNFDLSKVANGRKYGNGVYFSEKPEVCLDYSKDMCSLILCLVLQGDNSKEIMEVKNGQQQSNTGAWAIVVPDVDQILPKYVINFTDKMLTPQMSMQQFQTPLQLFQRTMRQIPAYMQQNQTSMQQIPPFMQHNRSFMLQNPPSMLQNPPSMQQSPPSLQQSPPSLQQSPPSLHKIPPSSQQFQPLMQHFQSSMQQIPFKQQIPPQLLQIPPSLKQIPPHMQQIPASMQQFQHPMQQIPLPIQQFQPPMQQIPASTQQFQPPIQQIPASMQQFQPSMQQIPASTQQLQPSTYQNPPSVHQMSSSMHPVPSTMQLMAPMPAMHQQMPGMHQGWFF